MKIRTSGNGIPNMENPFDTMEKSWDDYTKRYISILKEFVSLMNKEQTITGSLDEEVCNVAGMFTNSKGFVHEFDYDGSRLDIDGKLRLQTEDPKEVINYLHRISNIGK